MAKDIRSASARRGRRIAKPAPDAPPASSSVEAKAIELFDGLRRAFKATPQIPETTERTRERYVRAIDSLANYLEDIGADAVWVERIDELAWALEDLTKGEFHPLLQPARFSSSPPPPPPTAGTS